MTEFEHSYDNYGMAELNSREEEFVDEDGQYESWRDDCSSQFDEELDALIKKYLSFKHHYMNSKYHLISALECKIKTLQELSL